MDFTIASILLLDGMTNGAVYALLGMATKFSETFLAVRFRQHTPQGELVGGPMEAIRHGLGPRWNGLALLYAALGTLGMFGLGNGIQAQEMTLSLQELSGLPPVGLGMVAAALVWAVLRGGLARLRATGVDRAVLCRGDEVVAGEKGLGAQLFAREFGEFGAGEIVVVEVSVAGETVEAVEFQVFGEVGHAEEAL